MNRGARHRTIFENDDECAEFIGFAAELPERFGVMIHAYALMPNHYHLAVESTRGRLSAAMSFLAGRYTQWSNNRHQGWDGSIFRGRFRNIVVYRDEHWHYLPLYLHLNPLRAGLVGNLAQSRWTSHGAYAGIDPVPEWLTTDDLLAGYGGAEGYLESLGDVVLGRQQPPEDFEQVTFTSYLRRPKEKKRKRGLRLRVLSTTTVLRAVARVCEVKVSSLRKTIRGREGNWPRKLAAYWLVMGANLKNTEAGEVLEMHPVRVSQALREIRERRHKDRDLDTLMAVLEAEILNR